MKDNGQLDSTRIMVLFSIETLFLAPHPTILLDEITKLVLKTMQMRNSCSYACALLFGQLYQQRCLPLSVHAVVDSIMQGAEITSVLQVVCDILQVE